MAYLAKDLVYSMTPVGGGSKIDLSGENGLVPFVIPRTSPNRVIPSQTSGMRREKTGRTDSTWSFTVDWNTTTHDLMTHIDKTWTFVWQPAGPTPNTNPQATGSCLIANITPGTDDNGGLTMTVECEAAVADIVWGTVA